MRTVPSSELRKPVQISTVVVLPAPFGPSSAVISPGGGLQRDVGDRDHARIALGEARYLDSGHAAKCRKASASAPGVGRIGTRADNYAIMVL